MTPPRFIPFEAMDARWQMEHLRRMHGCASHQDEPYRQACHASTVVPDGTLPHTHDKPARTRTEENT